MQNNLISRLQSTVRDIPDFPKPGIMFKDIGPLFRDPKLLNECLEAMALHAKSVGAEAIVGAESRGFLFGVPVALKCELPFLLARKKGKLPGEVVGETYALEYGTDTIEMQRDGIVAGRRYMIIDDVIATGGTAAAIARLIQKHGGQVSAYSFLIELGFLNGRKTLFENSPEGAIQSLWTIG